MTGVEVLVGELVLAGGPGRGVAGVGQVDPLAELRARWLLAKLGTPPSRHTLRAYNTDLDQWLAFCAARGIDPWAPTLTDGDVYRHLLGATPTRYGRPPEPATVGRKLSTVSSFYRFALGDGVVAVNPIREGSLPSVPNVSTTRGLSQQEAAAFMRRVRDDECAFDRALVHVLLIEGPRTDEVRRLDVGSVGVDGGRPVVRIMGKGNKPRTVVLDAVVCTSLDEMLDERAVERGLGGAGELPVDGPLFARSDGRRLTQRSMVRILQRIARAAGIADYRKVTPHVMRHACATLALDSGRVGLHEVRDQLGHAHASTTERYDRARGRLSRSAATVSAVSAYIDPGEAAAG